MIPVDNMGNYSIQFSDLTEAGEVKPQDINLLAELNNASTKDMLQDIEKLLSRPLSSKEMEMYIAWQKEFSFTPELILLLIQYCSSKGKNDWRYIEKTALAWFDSKIRTVEDAQSFIKKHEDKWIKIRKVLNYLGIKDAEIMKPQEEMINKWINSYNFSLEVIYKACNVCFERINKADFKYIDGILTSWSKEGIKTVEEVDKKDTKKGYYKNSNYRSNQNPKSIGGNFNNFEQRDYDFEDLEKKLLGWDNND